MTRRPLAMIIDYGMGNLFSIRHACQHAGIDVQISADRNDLEKVDAIILPGVGAFGDAMANLKSLGIIESLRECAASGKPIVGICLGMQLFMSESEEFGRHQGLDLLSGKVVRFANPAGKRGALKVPQVGWNRIYAPDSNATGSGNRIELADLWCATPLEGIKPGSYMYFVHSYYVISDDPSLMLSQSQYGNITFCSGIWKDNIFACQFHPERSGENGLKIYRNLAKFIQTHSQKKN